MNVEILARVQFAFTIGFHYIYPPLSIGLGLVLVILEAGSTGSVNVRNPWPGQATTVLDGVTNAVVVPSTTGTTFSITTTSGHWYILVPTSAAASPPNVVVTGTPATKPIALGDVTIGL